MQLYAVIYKIIRRLLKEISNFREFLIYRFFYKKPDIKYPEKITHLLYGAIHDQTGLLEIYRECFPDKYNEKIQQADLVCQHIFDLLGSGPKKLSTDGEGYQIIDWHSDFKIGYKWRGSTFCKYIQFGHINGVDIKTPWELSYFHHLALLGEAYVLTGNEKYAREYENQISDWINNNKVGFGVGWACAMIVAIRVVNWLAALEFYSKTMPFSDAFLQKLYASVDEHGKFIRSHLEYESGAATNHYLFNLAGLLFISIYCSFLKEAADWQKFAINELSKEIRKQVYDDGCNFEASTSYHKFVLEMFFYLDVIGERAGIEFPDYYQKKLKEMFEFLVYGLKPDGTIPQVGDNDSGRFIMSCKRPVLEHKYLLSAASIYYNDSKFKLPYVDFDEEAFWIFGYRGKKIFDGLPKRVKRSQSKAFKDAGWYIMRDNNNYCFISCGPNGQKGKGGHAHNDKLSFELMLGGRNIIVDPGTYIYSSYPEERNKFRSTEYHNTVKFAEHEQNKMPETNMFGLPDRVSINCADLIETDRCITFTGGIEYEGITHHRTIELDKKNESLKIMDGLSSSDICEVKLIFHLAPELTYDGGFILIRETHDRVASIEVDGFNLIKENYDYSPEYGLKISAEKLTAYIPFKYSPQTVNTLIKRCRHEHVQ